MAIRKKRLLMLSNGLFLKRRLSTTPRQPLTYEFYSLQTVARGLANFEVFGGFRRVSGGFPVNPYRQVVREQVVSKVNLLGRYCCTSFAVFFGTVASVLSALRVWISYCARKGESAKV